MFAKDRCFGLSGIDAFEVTVETDVHSGLPGIDVVGLGDASVKEAKERVKSAIKNSGFRLAPNRITINLAPADTKKEGTLYDLAVALGILGATGQVSAFKLKDSGTAFIGELSLDGKLRGVRGILPLIISAVKKGCRRFVIPYANAVEASYVNGAEVYALSSLTEAANFVELPESFEPIEKRNFFALGSAAVFKEDFKYIKGQAFARRAMEVAAAGGHNILLIGPPGSGKTMLAKCLPSILPDLSADEAMETTKIHSVAGLIPDGEGIITARPFRAPHHTASQVSITGGGARATPGEISLAHNGVLFLDELPEYPRSVLEVLRQPLENKEILISRASRAVSYPADFMLVSGMNPCPCGNHGSKTKECVCSPSQITKYLSKLSGPLLDRIDMHIEADNVTYEDLKGAEGENSESIRIRVNDARKIQTERYKGRGITHNASLDAELIKEYCVLNEKSELLLKKAFEKLGLSVRAYTRVLKVARTIADLEQKDGIGFSHVSEALSYRCMDRRS